MYIVKLSVQFNAVCVYFLAYWQKMAIGVVEAASSSLVTQTISSVHNRFQLWTLDIFYVCIYISLFGVALGYSFSFRLRLVGIRLPRLDGSRG